MKFYNSVQLKLIYKSLLENKIFEDSEVQGELFGEPLTNQPIPVPQGIRNPANLVGGTIPAELLRQALNGEFNRPNRSNLEDTLHQVWTAWNAWNTENPNYSRELGYDPTGLLQYARIPLGPDHSPIQLTPPYYWHQNANGSYSVVHRVAGQEPPGRFVHNFEFFGFGRAAERVPFGRYYRYPGNQPFIPLPDTVRGNDSANYHYPTNLSDQQLIQILNQYAEDDINLTDPDTWPDNFTLDDWLARFDRLCQQIFGYFEYGTIANGPSLQAHSPYARTRMTRAPEGFHGFIWRPGPPAMIHMPAHSTGGLLNPAHNLQRLLPNPLPPNFFSPAPSNVTTVVDYMIWYFYGTPPTNPSDPNFNPGYAQMGREGPIPELSNTNLSGFGLGKWFPDIHRQWVQRQNAPGVGLPNLQGEFPGMRPRPNIGGRRGR